jgi:hypothetical protein
MSDWRMTTEFMFLGLTTSDSPDTKFYVRADDIVAMYRRKGTEYDYTVINYRSFSGGSWCVKETPEQIMKMMRGEQ